MLKHASCISTQLYYSVFDGMVCCVVKLESQCEQLQLKVRTLQLDWETEQKRSISYFNQIMELEKERDQVSRSE